MVDGGAAVADAMSDTGGWKPRAVRGVAIVAEGSEVVVFALGAGSVDLQVEVATCEDVEGVEGSWASAEGQSDLGA